MILDKLHRTRRLQEPNFEFLFNDADQSGFRFHKYSHKIVVVIYYKTKTKQFDTDQTYTFPTMNAAYIGVVNRLTHYRPSGEFR